MDPPRTSLWSRLVFYYSDHKPDQLKPEVMADIVEKYASKEGELSARLRKKYGHPLPSEVSVQDLRRVLANFGLEDKDLRESCEQENLLSDKTPASQAGYKQVVAPSPAGSEATGRPDVGTGHQESPPGGSALDFRSKYFDPLQALRHRTLRPPFPDEPVLDNLAKFRRLLPKIPLSTTVAPSTAIGDGGVDAFARPTQDGPVTAPDSATDIPSGGGYGPGFSSAGTAHAGGGSSVAQYRQPTLRSAAELDKMDRELASRRRASDLASHMSSTGPDNLKEGLNPLTKIMNKYVGTGPYSLLYRLHDERRRANVMIRRVNSIRGTCSGLIRAFDRHMNILLVDVREDYTALVPVRERAPSRARPVFADEDGQHSHGASELPGVGPDDWESEASASRGIDFRRVPKFSGEIVYGEGDRRTRSDLEMRSMYVREQGPQQVATVTEARKVETGGGRGEVANDQVSTAGVGDLAHAAESPVSTQRRTRITDDRGGVGQGNRTAIEDERGGTGRKKSSRRYRRRGVRTGEIQLVKRRRFLKQLLIRGDNIVMVWEEPKYLP